MYQNISLTNKKRNLIVLTCDIIKTSFMHAPWEELQPYDGIDDNHKNN